MDCSTPGFLVHHQLRSLLKLVYVELVIPSNRLILCCPLLLPPSIFPSIRVFTDELVLHIRWPKYWSFSFSISPSNEYSGLISFRMDWLDLLAVQGTLKSLLQHRSSKASILQHSAFFIVQLSHPYMTTGKTIALTRWTFVDKVMSLLFNMLSRLVIAFLPRSKRLLILCKNHLTASPRNPGSSVRSVAVSATRISPLVFGGFSRPLMALWKSFVFVWCHPHASGPNTATPGMGFVNSGVSRRGTVGAFFLVGFVCLQWCYPAVQNAVTPPLWWASPCSGPSGYKRSHCPKGSY